MKKINSRTVKCFALLIFAWSIVAASAVSTSAQKRDQLTAEEVELVRDAQQIDLRTKVFVKAVERRFQVLNNEAAPPENEKETGKWGAMPTGTRGELLRDIEKILQEAVDNIDDVAARDDKSQFFIKAVHILDEAAQKFLPQLKNQLDKAQDEREKGAILTAIDLCSQVIEAATKVPKEVPKEEKKKKSKNDGR